MTLIKWEIYEEPYGPHTPWLDGVCRGEVYSCLCHAREQAQYEGAKLDVNIPIKLSIDEGQADVNCTYCGCIPFGIEGYELFMEDVPVELVFVPEHEGLGGWHGDTRCDCGWWWEIKLKEQI